MRILETKVYTFEDLSEEAKERAIERNRHINVEYWEWYHDVYDVFKEKYSDLFEITNIYFSGIYSQGAGAMFEYDGITNKLIDEFIAQLNLSPLRKKIVRDIFYFSSSGKQMGQYYFSCRHSTNVEHNYIVSLGTYLNIDEYMYKLQLDFAHYIEDKYIELAQELYQLLINNYEWHTSDENVSESLINNEYEFTEQGEMV
jgi:hypothetical protein